MTNNKNAIIPVPTISYPVVRILLCHSKLPNKLPSGIKKAWTHWAIAERTSNQNYMLHIANIIRQFVGEWAGESAFSNKEEVAIMKRRYEVAINERSKYSRKLKGILAQVIYGEEHITKWFVKKTAYMLSTQPDFIIKQNVMPESSRRFWEVVEEEHIVGVGIPPWKIRYLEIRQPLISYVEQTSELEMWEEKRNELVKELKRLFSRTNEKSFAEQIKEKMDFLLSFNPDDIQATLQELPRYIERAQKEDEENGHEIGKGNVKYYGKKR